MDIQKRLITVNFEKRETKKLGICLHTMVGSLDGTDAWFRNPDAKASSFYGVGLDGKIYQWVEEKYVAWTQGRVSNATNPLYLEKKGNPNDYFIGIECADNGKPHEADRITQEQVLARLVADIAKRHNIPIDRKHICGHREIYDRKTCPGNLDVDLVVDMAKTFDTPQPTPEKPNNYVLLIDYLHEKAYVEGDGNLEGAMREIIGHDKDFPKLEKDIVGYQERLIKKTNEIEARDKQLNEKNEEITELRGLLETTQKALKACRDEQSQTPEEEEEPPVNPWQSFFEFISRMFKK